MPKRSSSVPRHLTSVEYTTQTAWAPGLKPGGHTIISFTGGSGQNLTLQGVSSTGMPPGTMFTIKNDALVGFVFLHHAHSTPAAADKLNNQGNDSTSWIGGRGSASYIHDGTNWKLVHIHYGTALGATFSAADYTAQTAGTWTVETAETSPRYVLVDGQLFSTIWVSGSDVAQSGGEPTALRISNTAWAPSGATPNVTGRVPAIIIDNGTRSTGYAQFTSGSAFVEFKKLDGSQFAASSGATGVFTSFVIDIG